ncbi:transposase family protein [Actinomyces bowdenii]|uniref:transposase family protein n=1 Tax=Actinomyces bowdenii TaxID=131109 RepID=UPI0034D1D958
MDRRYCLHCPWCADPIKKTPGRDRLEWEKELNRAVSSTRAAIEHTIAALKKRKILTRRLSPPPVRTPQHYHPGHQTRTLQNRMVTFT